MAKPIIEVHNISKKYRIEAKEPYYSLRDAITDVIKKPFSPKTENTARNNNEFWALKDVSFQVEHGEVLGIIGRNGAGKTTLLKILSQITLPTHGEITLRGRVASLLEVGTGFHPELTGRENIFLNGAILGMTRKEVKNKFDEIVDFAEIEKFLDTPIKHYSSGMYMRLAFAVAAHLEPEILLVDEVLAVGDIQFQKKCLGKMGDVARQGKTILFVSHNMNAISKLCRRCILLDQGRITEEGMSAKVISHYLYKGYINGQGNINLVNPRLRTNSLTNNTFTFTNIEILDFRGKSTSILTSKKPFEIIIEGKIQQSINNLLISFTITSMVGHPLCNNQWTSDQLSINDFKGIIKLFLKFDPNIFSPGIYTLGLGAKGNGTIDWIPEAARISIVDEPTERENFRSIYDSIVIYPYDWKIEKIK